MNRRARCERPSDVFIGLSERIIVFSERARPRILAGRPHLSERQPAHDSIQTYGAC